MRHWKWGDGVGKMMLGSLAVESVLSSFLPAREEYCYFSSSWLKERKVSGSVEGLFLSRK